LTWKEDGWSDIISNPTRLDCEIRATSALNEDFCESYSRQRVYISGNSGNQLIANVFSYPPSFLSACDFPNYLEAGASYTVQVRCFIRVPDFGVYSTITPWSEPVTVSLPECNGFSSEAGKAFEASLLKLDEQHWSIQTDEGQYSFALYELSGRLLKKGNFTYSKTFDLSSYPSGIYFLSIWNEASNQQHFSLFRE